MPQIPPMTQAATAATVGVLFILGYLAVNRAPYVLWMGCTFLALAVAALLLPPVQFGGYLVAIAFFGLAVRAAIVETRRRLRRFQTEQRDREEAFKEYMEELAKQARGKTSGGA